MNIFNSCLAFSSEYSPNNHNIYKCLGSILKVLTILNFSYYYYSDIRDGIQEFLDAIVDEIHLCAEEINGTTPLEGRPHNDTAQTKFPNPARNSRSSTGIPNIIISAEYSSAHPHKKYVKSNFSDDMEQYLIGYGEDYGQVSSSNLLGDQEPHNKTDVNIDDDVDSVAVLTSLGSSQTDAHNSVAKNDSLPTEIESVSDQVRRLHMSIEAHKNTSPKVGCFKHKLVILLCYC